MKRLLLSILSLSLCGMYSYAQYGFGGYGNNENLNSYPSKKDINYAGDGKTYHAMDVYYPKEAKDSYPVIIHIYGSAWSSNNGKGNADLGTVGKAAVEAGYIFVTPNHRSNSDAQWPGQINDIKAVARYLRGNAEELKVDTSFIAISGFSSGGHLATMMGTSRNVEKEYTVGSATMDIEGNIGNFTEFSSSVDAVCDWSGPVILDKVNCGNAMDLNSFIAPLFGNCSASQCPDKYALATAVTFIDPSDPPYMIVHGSADPIVAQCQSEMLYDELQKGGVECEYIPTGGQHGVSEDKCPDMISFFNKAREKKAESMHTSIDNTNTLKTDIYLDGNKIFYANSEKHPFSITIVTGNVVYQGVADDSGIDISRLPSGIYLLRLENGTVFKFSKQPNKL